MSGREPRHYHARPFMGRARRPAMSARAPELPGDYNCLVIDPPWPQHVQRYAFQGRGDPRRGKVYPTMTLKEIMGFDIGRWASERCHVFTFATQVSIQWVYAVIARWGVQYRLTRTWWKHRGVNTQRLLRSTEFIIYGTIGGLLPLKKAMPAIIDVPAGNLPHSEKPQALYDDVAELCDGPYMDVFARQSRPNFDSWGLEAPGGCSP